jgi:hypothetical protein
VPSRPGAQPRLPTEHRISRLFMVGSACFAVASLPFAASLAHQGIVGITYFTGSVFFTAAAFEQLRASEPDSLGWWASVVQFAGTIFFNVSTFAAMKQGLSGHQTNLLVWAPDTVGSIGFLVSSVLAVPEARGNNIATRVAIENLVGSVAFGISAIAAYIVPNTDQALNAAAATTWTLIGAILFFRAAQLLPRATERARTT